VLILVAYDVSTVLPAGVRRLRRVAQICQDYGQRVQKSVFECRLGSTEWVGLRSRLLEEINPAEDSLRFYFLEEDSRIEHHGSCGPPDLAGPLIV
jgi:CRISPR-associated protein Cas2